VYIRRAAVTIEPHGRARRTGNGSDWCQRVRVASQRRIAATASNTIKTGEGLPTNAVSRLDPVATAPQKKSVAVDPTADPAGTAKLASRQLSSAQAIGSVHCAFVFGPVGPL
jgi:hypothetical protein